MGEEEEDIPIILRIIGRGFWLTAGFYSFYYLQKGEKYRPYLWTAALYSYLGTLILAVLVSIYLRVFIGPGVPRYRWRMYIPRSIYTLTILQIVGFVLMLLGVGISLIHFFMMICLNMSIISFLSFI